MSQRNKLLQRLCSRPRDFAWSELRTLLNSLGYVMEPGAGSRRKFYHAEKKVLICLHQPHPGRVLKRYQVDEVLQHLKQEGYL